MPEPTVFIIDDDTAVRSSLAYLVESAGHHVQAFDCAQSFLRHFEIDAPGCLLLDVHLPHMTGLDLQERLAKQGATLPIIMMTGQIKTQTIVKAMKLGAVDFIGKPPENDALLESIDSALAQDARLRAEHADRLKIAAQVRSLTKRERQVLSLVVVGLANKAIANELSISTKTVESHRSRVMTKMQVSSLAELVRKCIECEKLKDQALSCIS